MKVPTELPEFVRACPLWAVSYRLRPLILGRGDGSTTARKRIGVPRVLQ
jgi:hypothetical protein